jgi:hypothetical protein
MTLWIVVAMAISWTIPATGSPLFVCEGLEWRSIST